MIFLREASNISLFIGAKPIIVRRKIKNTQTNLEIYVALNARLLWLYNAD